MSYYRIIGGVRYERSLLEAAEAATQGRGEGRISLDEIQAIYQLALDGRRITDIERRTLLYIAELYPLTDKARAWLEEKMAEAGGPGDLDKLSERILRGEYGLGALRWEIPAAEVRQQETAYGGRLLGEALRGAINAFLRYGQGPLSFSAVVYRRDFEMAISSAPEAILKRYLDRGSLLLLPAGEAAREALPFDAPDFLDFENFWYFGFYSDDFPGLQFLALVNRHQAYEFSRGYFSRQLDTQEIARRAIRQYATQDLDWQIDNEEVSRQLALLPGQNFGNALFAAVYEGIFNGESSFSFRDFIRQEVWKAPGSDLSDYITQYLRQGTLFLIPLDYRAQTLAGTAAFPVPETFSFWMEGDWVFGLTLARTHVRFIITTPRENNDGGMGWNDGFIPAGLPDAAILQNIVDQEFNIQGLQYDISLAEAEAQRQQYGPDWWHTPGLMRKALNTALHDYVTAGSVFNYVAEVHHDEVSASNFDDPKEFREAIAALTRRYLKSGTLLFTAADEGAFPRGETAEDAFRFRLRLPGLAEEDFYIVIPRWPDDEEAALCYKG